MAISARDRRIIRDLARRVAEIAALPEQAEKVLLWTACNDLKPERPMVFADQPAWEDLHAAWGAIECEEETLRSFETALRRKIIRHEHIPDDYPVLNTFRIEPCTTGSAYQDYGLQPKVIRHSAVENSAEVKARGAYQIEPVLKTEEDLAKLHFRPIRIDHEATSRMFELAGSIFGDILDVQPSGRTHWRYGLTRPLIHLRGLDQMMLDMYENPGLLHRLMSLFRDDFLHEIALFEQDNAIALNSTPDHVTGSGGLAPTADLPGSDFDGVPRVKHCICWGESQETVGVGPEQFDEFVLQYQLPIMSRFGLVDYGCCEPLDQKLDLLIEKVPHLRWIAVSPWADREFAAEKIGKSYVYVYKPNPSLICSRKPDWQQAEQSIRETISIARECPMHIVLKDASPLYGEPDRITEWAQMASNIVDEMG